MLRGDRGCKVEVSGESGKCSQNARRYATFIKVKGPEGAHEIAAPKPITLCSGFRGSEAKRGGKCESVSAASMEEYKKRLRCKMQTLLHN